MLFRLVFLLSIFAFSLELSAQQEGSISDTINIKEVKIVEKKVIPTGFKSSIFTKKQILASKTGLLSEFLGKSCGLNIKSYGQSQLATSSIRGASASHTQVLWNGVEINSPMLGQTDFSQIPVLFIDRLKLFHGGNPLSNTNGAIGGSIALLNRPEWNNRMKMSVYQEIGNSNLANSFAELNWGNKKFQSKTKISNHYSDFDNYRGERKVNADVRKTGVMQEFYIKKRKNVFSARIWYQNNELINNFNVQGKEKQNDVFLHAVFDWKHFTDNGKITARSYFSSVKMDYRDKLKNIDSKNDYLKLGNYVDYTQQFGKHFIWNSGINFTYNKIETNNYDETKNGNVFSLFSGLNWLLSKKINSYFLLKQEFNDFKRLPFIPSLGISYNFIKLFYLKSNISRNLHLPGYNDLYWNPGGNPDLKHETGYSFELGISKQRRQNRLLNFSGELTFFYSRIHDMIQWLPASSTIWTPVNLKDIASRGIESMARLGLAYPDFTASLQAGYNLTFATNRKSNSENLGIKGKKLIYVPQNKYFFKLLFKYKNTGLMISHHYTGERFTSSDNKNKLSAFRQNDLVLMQSFNVKSYIFKAHFAIDNLDNKKIEVMKGYFGTGRILRIGIYVSLIKPTLR